MRPIGQYVKASEDNAAKIQACKHAANVLAKVIDGNIPDGPDKTYIMRRLHEVAMWTTVAILNEGDSI